MTHKKNWNLCERPYCREPFQWYVGGWSGYRGWTLRVCDYHVQQYRRESSVRGQYASISERKPTDTNFVSATKVR
jgi:hypothetical protein